MTIYVISVLNIFRITVQNVYLLIVKNMFKPRATVVMYTNNMFVCLTFHPIIPYKEWNRITSKVDFLYIGT